MEEITSEQVAIQGTATSDNIASDSHSYDKGSSPHVISDRIHHSRSMDKSKLTGPCGSGTCSTELSIVHTLSSNITAKDSEMNDPMTSASADVSAYEVMIRYHDKLVTALSTDITTISGILVAKEFIPPEISSRMLLQTFTPQEKATVLVNAVTDKIKVAPKRFNELVQIFSEQNCTKDIVSSLISQVRHIQDDKDNIQECDTEMISSSEQYAICEGHMYTVWASLNPDDKIDLEARLIDDAEAIREEFALLCWRVRDSFEQRDIKPLTLASALLDLTISEESSNGSISIPFFKEKEGALMSAKSVHDIFHVLRPHMNFFNYEVLQFLIKGKGSKEDKIALNVFLKKFEEFCKRHVFEVPFTVYSNTQSPDDPVTQQRFHVKVTRHFKAALLTQSASRSVPTASDNTHCQVEKICSNELGINLEDAKNIQRKLAKILKLKPSSLFLDCISEGSVILTFLLPMCVSLAGLDHNPDIARLSSIGVFILCGPPGKPEVKELTPNGVIMRWSPPDYGCNSLAQYTLYYQKKDELKPSEWQQLELSSLQTHTCVPDLSDGDTYVFKIYTVSDIGTLQYSSESDPIVISADGILTKDVHKVIVANQDTLVSAFSSADPSTIAEIISIKELISKEDETQISLASTPSEKATLLIIAIEHQIKSAPEKFQDILNVLQKIRLSLPSDTVETLWSDHYDNVYKQYPDYLRFLYASLDKKLTFSDQCPPSATKKFFRLAMIKTDTVRSGYIEDRFIRMTITGKVDDILRQKYPIQLQDIFMETEGERKDNNLLQMYKGRRKVILLEGAPGCGKSTLSVYICQQWKIGQLFNQFKLVILIRLREPAVKNAKDIADLLPCPDTTTAQQIAARMLTDKCRDVLFILDGWDELPPNLRNDSIFHQLVHPTLPQSNSLHKSTVIVTSRPIASGDLHQVVSSRIEILGFTAEKLNEFFTECLKGDTEAVKTLLERIEENPEVAGSCYLPLNATILVHLFKNDRNTLPTTLYGIFSNLILNCIKRHLKLRTQYNGVSIESLDQLPVFVNEPFTVLCRFAYDGVMDDKKIFASLPPDVNTLSLLQGMESFIGREKKVSYNFIHLSIQELLAAWYIAKQLCANDQVSKFNELFDKSRFSTVFRFYAAITKLMTPGIKDVVINVAKKYSSNFNPPDKDKVLMVSLLHCLNEAQDSSLCESAAQQLQNGLDLYGITLTPSDCLCIGYFLAHVCKMDAGEFMVNLEKCGISDQGCKYLVSGLQKYLDTDSVVKTVLIVDMGSNTISYHGVQHLSTLLEFSCINYLKLNFNHLLSEHDAIHLPFCTLAEQIKKNTTLKTLWLQGCDLNSQSAESLAEALTTNKHLEELYVSDNALGDDGIQHLAHALKVNQGLYELYLSSCGMSDVGFEVLAKSLQHNKVLNRVVLPNSSSSSHSPNRISENIVPILTKYLQDNHSLTELVLPENLKSCTANIEKAVNDVRKRNGLPLIYVSGTYFCM